MNVISGISKSGINDHSIILVKNSLKYNIYINIRCIDKGCISFLQIFFSFSSCYYSFSVILAKLIVA